MKLSRISISALIAVILGFILAGCARVEQPDYREKDYGYVQFKIYKEASYPGTKAAQLDYLADVAKLKVTLRFEDNLISQTLVMGASSDAALKAGGTVTGVIPQFMVENGWHHHQLTQLVVTETMHERKQLMAKMSDGVIALPGGCGTMEELMEIITWKQLGLFLKPIIILNIDGFYDPLLCMFQKAIETHFMRPEHGAIWQVAQTPEEAIDMLYNIPHWNKDIQKIASI